MPELRLVYGSEPRLYKITNDIVPFCHAVVMLFTYNPLSIEKNRGTGNGVLTDMAWKLRLCSCAQTLVTRKCVRPNKLVFVFKREPATTTHRLPNQPERVLVGLGVAEARAVLLVTLQYVSWFSSCQTRPVCNNTP